MRRFVIIVATLLVSSNIYAQIFPRQTDGRDSTAIRQPATQRWGYVIVGRGADNLWHVLRTDSMGYLAVLEPVWTAMFDTTITATTTEDTIPLHRTYNYISIAAKESFGYYVGFKSLQDTAAIYIPPGCVWNAPVQTDTVFIKMEENTSIISVVGVDRN